MKGVKCIKRLFYLALLICAFAFISPSKNASAASLNSVSFDMYYKINDASSYIWDNDLYYQAPMQTINPGGGFLQYRINTASVTAENSNAVLHFETNIVVKSKYDSVWSAWYHLPEQELITCVPSVSGITITQKNLSYAVTNWTHTETGPQPNDWYDSTLTLYGTIAMRGFTSGQSVYFTCAVGSNNYSMLYVANPLIIYLEQNPMTIDWSDNQTDNLLYYQINQNQTIINNQNQINDYLTDNTPPSADTSVISGSAGWLPPGPVDSLLTLPITLAQGILGVFTGTHQCSPISLPLSLGPYSFNLDIPCLDSYFSLASVNIIWNAVGVIISAFVIYSTLRWLYTFVDDTLTFRENNSGMWGGL